MKYVIQLDPTVPQAWQFMISWQGYWTGLGYVKDPRKAVAFSRKRDALQVMHGEFLGMNGCMKVVSLPNGER